MTLKRDGRVLLVEVRPGTQLPAFVGPDPATNPPPLLPTTLQQERQGKGGAQKNTR